MEGQSDTAQDFRGGLLVGYCPRETLDENGNYLRYATGYLLLTADGATYDLPGPARGRSGPTTAPPGTGSTTAAGAGRPPIPAAAG